MGAVSTKVHVCIYSFKDAPEVLDEAGGQVADAGQALHGVVAADDLVVRRVRVHLVLVLHVPARRLQFNGKGSNKKRVEAF